MPRKFRPWVALSELVVDATNREPWAKRFSFLVVALSIWAGCEAGAPPSKEHVDTGQPAPAKDAAFGTPTLVCPAKDFRSFLHAFANSADLQLAFSDNPIRFKSPYYWKHNTEPGDPRYPRWHVQLLDNKDGVSFRYDAQSKQYVFDRRRLKPGELWRRSKPDEAARGVVPLDDFKVVRLSVDRYRVIPSQGTIETFVYRTGCWRHIESWRTEPMVYCRWPKQCKECREWEKGDQNDALCESIGKGRL